MSDQTTGSPGRVLKSLFGTLTANGASKRAEATDNAPIQAPPTSAAAGTPPVVIDGVRPPGLPHVLPPGTVIVVNPVQPLVSNPAVVPVAPVAVSAPVYDFNASPGSEAVDAAHIAKVPAATVARTYDFPVPAREPALEADSANLAAPNALSKDLGGAAAAVPTESAGGNQPARPALVVPATVSGTLGGREANSAPAGKAQHDGTPDRDAVDANALPPPPIPTPPPVSGANAAVMGLGTGIAITDILRLAAQLSAERTVLAAPAPAAGNALGPDDERVKELRDRLIKDIDDLYQKTIETVGDSPGVVAYCLDLLKKARLALLTGSTAEDLSQAEFYVEEVRSKLSRSRDPIPKGEGWNVLGLLLWTIGFWVLCLPLALLPWFAPTGVVSGWNFRIPVEMIPLLATVGWGGTGGVIGVLYNITWFVQMREYDPAYNLDYFLRPIKGFIAGGVMMLIFTAGIATLNGPQAALGADKASLGFALVYLGAALAGFKQEYVYEWFDSLLKVFFRTPPSTPKQLDAGAK